MSSTTKLTVPRVRSRLQPSAKFNPEAFGSLSEGFARYMGTSKFIAQMSLFILAWFIWNTLAPQHLRFDPYTFTFLTLLLSLQASYAAPLILLAQNRQDNRDRSEARIDRERAAMGIEVNAFLARELSDMRKRLNEISSDINQQRERNTGKNQPKDINRRLSRIEASLELLLEREGVQGPS